MNMKPMKTIVHIPLTVNGKFVRYKMLGQTEFVDVKVGDEFVLEKRAGLDVPLDKLKTSTVKRVIYSVIDRGNLVELEPKEFKSIEKLNKY